MSAATPEKIGFVGLGDQGAPMARAIAEAGFELHVWARRPQSYETISGGAIHPARHAGKPRRIWSVTCFFVRRDHRGKGLSGRMLDAAVELAKRSGARAVEGYPVEPDSPSYRFMDFLALFQKRGFREVARAGSRRHVLRLEL